MDRRTFIRQFLTAFNYLLLLLQLYPAVSLAAARSRENGGLHYAPLNGVALREIAERKLHHGPDGRFLNPLGELRRRRRFGRLLQWKLFSDNRFRKYLPEQPVNPVTVDWEPIRNRRDLSVTFLKHASVLIKDIDRTYLVDPVFERIFWFIRDYTPLAFEVDRMPRPDHILITHGHYDHLDIPSLKRFDPGTHVISPIGYNEIFNGLGMHNRTQLDWFERHRENGREFTLLPANHWTMRSVLEGPNTALWGGYLIKTASGHTLYLSGDTAWFDGFDQIGSQWDIDLAIVNLGAYEPRWFMAPSHMNPAETVAALKQLRAKKLIITHWGTFRLGDEPVHFPPQDLEAALKAEGLQDRRIELGHGETFFA